MRPQGRHREGIDATLLIHRAAMQDALSSLGVSAKVLNVEPGAENSLLATIEIPNLFDRIRHNAILDITLAYGSKQKPPIDVGVSIVHANHV